MKTGIYVTSKIKHAPMWKHYRDDGWPIINSWLDNVDEGTYCDFESIWIDYIRECASCVVLVAYIAPGERLRGGIVEIGAALGSGAPIYIVGECPELGTAIRHPSFNYFNSVKEAMLEAKAFVNGRDDSNASKKAITLKNRYCDNLR